MGLIGFFVGLFSKEGRKEDDTFQIFYFISGFNNHSVGGKFSLNPNEMVASPRQGVKNTLIIFGVDMSIIRCF